MKNPTRLALLSVLGLTLASCVEDRPLLVAQDDGGNPTGAAGTTSASGTAGTTASGAAGTTTTGAAGTTASGAAGSGGPGCDITPLVAKYYCTLAGACHDANGSAAHLDMVSNGWEKRLVGLAPTNSPPAPVPSLCADQGHVELVRGSSPAVGLFMDKFKAQPPCGITMPQLAPPVTDTDLACFQSWANALVAQ